MMDIIEQRGGKIVIWCRFHEDIEIVMKKLGSKAVDYYGKTSEAQRSINKQLFLDPNSGVEYFVASPEAAGTGMDGLQHVCQTAIYYSNSFNSLARWQSEGRIWRDGTTGTAMYFDLIAKGSPDNRILANLKDKKDISDLTLDEYRKLIESEAAEEFS
jgi:SNF2 family DNA or RNA helicase